MQRQLHRESLLKLMVNVNPSLHAVADQKILQQHPQKGPWRIAEIGIHFASRHGLLAAACWRPGASYYPARVPLADRGEAPVISTL